MAAAILDFDENLIFTCDARAFLWVDKWESSITAREVTDCSPLCRTKIRNNSATNVSKSLLKKSYLSTKTPPHWGKDFWIQLSLTNGLEAVAQLPDHQDVQMSLRGIFFFRGYVKDKVYTKEIWRSSENLRASIISVIATVTMEILLGTWLELEYRLDIFRATKGARVEMHWLS